MIKRLRYRNDKRVKWVEFCVPWGDVWNAEYAKAFSAFYEKHKDVYRVSESDKGLIISIPSEFADAIAVPDLDTGMAKTKVKIKEVFRLCGQECTEVQN